MAELVELACISTPGETKPKPPGEPLGEENGRQRRASHDVERAQPTSHADEVHFTSDNEEGLRRQRSRSFVEDEDQPLNENAVANFGLPIRIGFRRKMLALLTLNTAGINIIAWTVYFVNPLNLNGRPAVILPTLLLYGMSMVMLSVNKKSYPLNYITLAWFTLTAGYFFGVAANGFNSYAGFQIIGYLFGLAFFFTIYSTTPWPPTASLYAEPPPLMMPLPTAAGLAWFTVFVISLVFLCIVQYGMAGHYASVILFTGALGWYFSYDTLAIELSLGPDEYMFGVVHFWADMVMCIFCCACIACMGGMG